MADTIPNIEITTTPVNLNTASSITAGTAIRIANVGNHRVRYAIKSTIPDKTGFRNIEVEGYGSVIEIAAGSNAVWAWAESGTMKGAVNVENNTVTP